MHPVDCFKIGYLAKTHGLKGEVTFMPSAECPDLTQISTIFIEVRNGLVPFFIETVSVRSDKAFLKLEDVTTPQGAQELKGCSVFLPKSERPKLPRGEFYNDELIGFQVADNGFGTLGAVEAIEESGPNRFLILTYAGKEIMIPVQGPFIKSVNKTKRLVTVELPEGFLDI